MRAVLILVSCALAATTARADDGDVAAGEQKAAPCAACHGPEGNSVNPEWPKIAGQHQKYLAEQLQAYKSGDRQGPLMVGQVAGLDEQDMRDLAAYFASRETSTGEADPELVDLGESIYRGGIAEKDVPACIACHGPTGKGNPAAGWPAVSGQHATYTANQLKAYRSGERRTDANQMMRNVAAELNDDEIAAVASYIQGLN